MTAKFLTRKEAAKQSERSFEIAKKHMEKRYGKNFGIALLSACMKLWGTGAITTVARLNSNASDAIIHAWKYRDHISGVLLQRHNNDYLPLFLQNSSLAYKLIDNGSIWVDFRKVEEELEHD